MCPATSTLVVGFGLLAFASCGRVPGKAPDAAGPDGAIVADSDSLEDADVVASALGQDAAGEAAAWDTLAGEAGASCSGPVYASIGSAGGILEHCGGKLVVPAGRLTEPITFGIAPAEAPAPPGPPSELGGRALRFTPDDAGLPGRVTIALPHDDCPRIYLYAVVDGALEYIEPCEVTTTQISQDVRFLGTFVAARDCYAYASSSRDLGSGTFTYTLDGKTKTLSIPDNASAIDQAWGPSALLTLNTKYPATFLQVNLAISDAGVGRVSYIIWDITWESVGSGEVQIDLIDEQHFRGSFQVPLSDGAETKTLTASFDVTAPFYTYEQEYACFVP